MIIEVVFWTLLALIGIILCILVFPFRLSLKGNLIWTETVNRGDISIYLGGLKRGISFAIYPKMIIRVGHFEKPIFNIYPTKKKKSKVKRKNNRERSKPYFKIGLAVLSRIYFDQLSLWGNLGLSNPMHTGLIYGWVHSAQHIFRSDRWLIKISPKFNNCLETDLHGHCRVKFIPGKVLWQAVKSYFKFKR